MTLKFERQEVGAALGPVNDGDVVSIALTASLYDGAEITLYDCVWIIDNTRAPLRTALESPSGSSGSRESAEQMTWGNIKALYR